MKLLWIGSPLEDKVLSDIIENGKGFPQVSANKLQWSMINGIEDISKWNIDIISAPGVGRYPLFPKIKFRRSRWSHNESNQNIYVGFYNIIFIKYLNITLSILFEIFLWYFKNRKEKNKLIICYGANFHQSIPTYIASIVFNIKFITIIPDFPDDSTSNNAGWRQSILKWVKHIENTIIQKSNGLVVLTKQAIDRLNINNIPNAIIEGCLDQKWIDFTPSQVNVFEGHKIFYGGSFDKRYGLETLLNAFDLIKDNKTELWLCGDGGMRSEVERRAAINPRIKYLGVVHPSKFMDLTQECSILINPRPSTGLYTLYSFPSKTIDYLAAQRPVIMSKLGGIPDEYFPYLFFVKDETPEGIAKTIEYVMSKDSDEIHDFAQKARDFVLNNKNQNKQMEKIIKLINQIYTS